MVYVSRNWMGVVFDEDRWGLGDGELMLWSWMVVVFDITV